MRLWGEERRVLLWIKNARTISNLNLCSVVVKKKKKKKNCFLSPFSWSSLQRHRPDMCKLRSHDVSGLLQLCPPELHEALLFLYT